MQGAHTATFGAPSDFHACFWVDSTPRMGEWVGGMGRFGMISPHGFAPFRLGIWTGPFPIGDMDWPLSNWGYGPALSLTCCPLTECYAFHGYKVHLSVL